MFKRSSHPLEVKEATKNTETFSIHSELGRPTLSVIETVQNFIKYYY